jgi:hypothetical protein
MKNLNEDTKISINQLPQQPLVHQFEESNNIFSRKLILSAVVIVLAGGFSGFILSRTLPQPNVVSVSDDKKTVAKKVVGSEDTKVYPDSAEGELQVGGINGEGTHSLIRPGGESQTVYLTSSVLDLNQFVGKKVKVWGQTFAAKKAGWLMDIGKVEVL